LILCKLHEIIEAAPEAPATGPGQELGLARRPHAHAQEHPQAAIDPGPAAPTIFL
jgi:hypothetical protein